MNTLSDGGNAALGGAQVTLTVSGDVDLTALVLSADGKVAGDADMVFFNQPSAPGVQLEGKTLKLDLTALRAGAEKVVLAASPASEGATFAGITVTLSLPEEGIDYTPSRLSSETVVVLAEIYERGGAYKVRAVGQGYDSGLAGLATDFGVDVSGDEETPAAQPVEVAPAPAPVIEFAKKPLGKIDLGKKGSATIPVDFSKKESLATVFKADLVWDGGSSMRRAKGADLDFYALWADKAGNTGCVYYRNLGSLTNAPYVQLKGDSKVPGIENVEITRPDQLAYVLLCAYSAVENGAGSFKSYGAKAVVDDGQGSQITVPLFDKSEKYWVAIAKLSFTDEGVKVEQVEDYGPKTTENRPMLYADGSYKMGAGPIEFKNS